MDITERRRAADALRAIKRGGEGWFSLSDAVLGRPAPRDEVVARLADLIDPGEDVSVSAYDLLREEDREAAEWVRKHNGIEYVKAHWEGRVARSHVEHMAERQRERRERMQRHIEHIQRLCRERRERIGELNKLKCAYVDALNGVCKRLGLTDGTGLPDMPEVIWAELDRRLMPEGMEWPRYESGEFVKFGDELEHYEQGHRFKVDVVEFTADGWRACHESGGVRDVYRPGERVKRPAHKVLDADGVEIGIGDKLYDTETGCARIVRAINACGTVEFEGCEDSGWFTKFLTHRAPVLAADGKPLEAGQTVYVIANGKTHHVTETDTVSKRFRSMEQVDGSHWLDPMCFTHQRPVLDADGVPCKDGDTVYALCDGSEHVVECVNENGTLKSAKPNSACYLVASRCTHTKPEPPDTWQRIEEDAKLAPGDYIEKHGRKTDLYAYEEMPIDLVRRCKALAERDE